MWQGFGMSGLGMRRGQGKTGGGQANTIMVSIFFAWHGNRAGVDKTGGKFGVGTRLKMAW